jgi:tetratricopeptide (TPR) repeat protein
MDLGRLDSAPHLSRSLALYEQCGDLPGQASVHNLLGGFAYWRGEWKQALEGYQRARDLARRIGDMVLDAFCASNIGEIALDQGDVEAADALFSDALLVWSAAGDRPGTTYAKCCLARVASRRGRWDEAFELFEAAERESLEVGAHLDALEARIRRAEALALQGRGDAASELAEDVLDQLRRHGGVMAHAPLIHRLRGAAHLGARNHQQARLALEESLAAGRARGSDYEVALSLELLGELGARSGDPAAHEHRRESAAILARLDVKSTPDLLARRSDREAPTAVTIDLTVLDERSDTNPPGVASPI